MLCRASHDTIFEITTYEIISKLREVNALYGNHDSIVIIPVSIDDVCAMTIIGKDLELIRENPNLLFI